MNETLSSIEFRSSAKAADVMDVVDAEGAAAIHNFLPPYLLERAARVLAAEQMRTDNNPNNEAVDRHHDLINYGYAQGQPWPVSTSLGGYAPEPVYKIAQAIANYITGAPYTSWDPNEITGHLYNPGDYIRRHRDSNRALGYVAVVTLSGSGQDFYVVNDDDQEVGIALEPGTLTIMRGNQPESGKRRPPHWVTEAPERRLAISLRQMRIV